MGFDPDHRVSCCYEGCYATINLAPKDYGRLKRTGEWFYCPAGHQQHFTGKTEDQKEIDRLKREINDWSRESTGLRRALTGAEAQRDTAIALLRRCPVCAATPGRHVMVKRDPAHYEDDLANLRDWMAEHVRSEHIAQVPA